MSLREFNDYCKPILDGIAEGDSFESIDLGAIKVQFPDGPQGDGWDVMTRKEALRELIMIKGVDAEKDKHGKAKVKSQTAWEEAFKDPDKFLLAEGEERNGPTGKPYRPKYLLRFAFEACVKRLLKQGGPGGRKPKSKVSTESWMR